MTPLQGKLLHAVMMALWTFLTSIAIYKGFSEITRDALFQPLIQALLQGLAALGIGPGIAALTRTPKNGG